MNNIWIAAADDRQDFVRSLVDSGKYAADAKDQNGYTPIHAAASYANTDLLRYLIAKGGNVNVQDSDGNTPLHHCESVDAAKVLIELGADSSIHNFEGRTAVEDMEEDGEFPELIKYLRGLEGKTVAEAPSFNGELIQMHLNKLADDDSPELVERRQRIQAIMTEKNISEEERDARLRDVVWEALGDIKNEDDHKKRRV